MPSRLGSGGLGLGKVALTSDATMSSNVAMVDGGSHEPTEHPVDGRWETVKSRTNRRVSTKRARLSGSPDPSTPPLALPVCRRRTRGARPATRCVPTWRPRWRPGWPTLRPSSPASRREEKSRPANGLWRAQSAEAAAEAAAAQLAAVANEQQQQAVGCPVRTRLARASAGVAGCELDSFSIECRAAARAAAGAGGRSSPRPSRSPSLPWSRPLESRAGLGGAEETLAGFAVLPASTRVRKLGGSQKKITYRICLTVQFQNQVITNKGIGTNQCHFWGFPEHSVLPAELCLLHTFCRTFLPAFCPHPHFWQDGESQHHP